MRERGFTTTELLLIVVIIGLLAALATPIFVPWLSSVKVHSAARDIVSDLQLARMKAISQNTNFRITFNPTNKTYQIEKEVSGVWQNVGAAKALPAGITLSITGNPAVFQSTGTATNSTTIILQNSQGKTKQVTVSVAGAIKMG